jgi:hypothetical protein
MNIAATSCWHLGHMRTSTEYICKNIRRYLFPILPDIDILIHAGDLFDQVCDLNTANVVVHANHLLIDLAHECIKHNVKVRLNRGTWTHDRTQLTYAYELMKKAGLTDIKLYNTVAVEYLSEYGIYIGYIPDDMPYKDTTSIISILKEQMKPYGIDKLDYIIAHGVFDVLDLPVKRGLVFNTELMESIVSKRIISGHIHTPSVHGKLIYVGSFDRLAHGEEHTKGFITVDDATNKVTFISNDDAYPYISVKLNDTLTTDTVLSYIFSKGEVMKLLDEIELGNIRFIISQSQLLTIKPYLAKWFNQNYPTIVITFLVTNQVGMIEQEEELSTTKVNNQLELINKETLPGIVYRRLLAMNHQVDIASIQNILTINK